LPSVSADQQLTGIELMVIYSDALDLAPRAISSRLRSQGYEATVDELLHPSCAAIEKI